MVNRELLGKIIGILHYASAPVVAEECFIQNDSHTSEDCFVVASRLLAMTPELLPIIN